MQQCCPPSSRAHTRSLFSSPPCEYVEKGWSERAWEEPCAVAEAFICVQNMHIININEDKYACRSHRPHSLPLARNLGMDPKGWGTPQQASLHAGALPRREPLQRQRRMCRQRWPLRKETKSAVSSEHRRRADKGGNGPPRGGQRAGQSLRESSLNAPLTDTAWRARPRGRPRRARHVLGTVASADEPAPTTSLG